MDAALTGGVVSAVIGLVALIAHKARCLVRCQEGDETPQWSAACGFTDKPIHSDDMRFERQSLYRRHPSDAALFERTYQLRALVRT